MIIIIPATISHNGHFSVIRIFIASSRCLFSQIFINHQYVTVMIIIINVTLTIFSSFPRRSAPPEQSKTFYPSWLVIYYASGGFIYLFSVLFSSSYFGSALVSLTSAETDLHIWLIPPTSPHPLSLYISCSWQYHLF